MWENENEFEEYICSKLTKSYHMEVVSCVGFPDRLILKGMKLVEFKHMDDVLGYRKNGKVYRKNIKVCADWFTENQLPRFTEIVKDTNIHLVGYNNDNIIHYLIKDFKDIKLLLTMTPTEMEINHQINESDLIELLS